MALLQVAHLFYVLSKDNRQAILITTSDIRNRCIWLKRPYLLDPYPFMVMVLIHFMIYLQECPTHSSLLWFMVFGLRFELPYSLRIGISYPSLSYFFLLCFCLNPSLLFHFMVYGFPFLGIGYGYGQEYSYGSFKFIFIKWPLASP